MCASISHAAYHNINLNYFLPHRKTNAKKKKPVKERKNRAHSLPHNVIHTQKKKHFYGHNHLILQFQENLFFFISVFPLMEDEVYQ